MDNSRELCRAFEALGAGIISKENLVDYWNGEYDKMAEKYRGLEQANANLMEENQKLQEQLALKSADKQLKCRE